MTQHPPVTLSPPFFPHIFSVTDLHDLNVSRPNDNCQVRELVVCQPSSSASTGARWQTFAHAYVSSISPGCNTYSRVRFPRESWIWNLTIDNNFIRVHEGVQACKQVTCRTITFIRCTVCTSILSSFLFSYRFTTRSLWWSPKVFLLSLNIRWKSAFATHRSLAAHVRWLLITIIRTTYLWRF